MKIFHAHNHYQSKGGEDQVVFLERELLVKNGHEVIPYDKYNQSIKSIGDKVATAYQVPYREKIRE